MGASFLKHRCCVDGCKAKTVGYIEAINNRRYYCRQHEDFVMNQTPSNNADRLNHLMEEFEETYG